MAEMRAAEIGEEVFKEGPEAFCARERKFCGALNNAQEALSPSNFQDAARSEAFMDVLKAIYTRRAVRNYRDVMIGSDELLPLLHAAVQAPSALNQQPWAFAVYQGRQKLLEYSEEAKEVFLEALEGDNEETQSLRETLATPHYNIFYNAGTLVVILSEKEGLDPVNDCLLAAENFMLAAHSQGFGTCPIGFAKLWLNRPETKLRLNIPERYEVVFPMIVGYPDEAPEGTPRNEPMIVAWEVSELDRIYSAAPVGGA
jgi:nitroreductase